MLRRVKLPKTFLAVNLSDAFTFEEQERLASDSEGLEMKTTPVKDLLSGGTASATEATTAAEDANDDKIVNPT